MEEEMERIEIDLREPLRKLVDEWLKERPQYADIRLDLLDLMSYATELGIQEGLKAAQMVLERGKLPIPSSQTKTEE